MTQRPVTSWSDLQQRLVRYLTGMVEGDHLILDTCSRDEGGAAPYVQAAAFGDDGLRAEAASNRVLGPSYRLGEGQLRDLTERHGWNEPRDEGTGPNFWREVHVEQDAELGARLLCAALAEVFAVSLDQLRVNAFGPTASRLSELGLQEAGDVPEHAERPPLMQYDDLPVEHDVLVTLVGSALKKWAGAELPVDHDGDHVHMHGERPVYVRVRPDLPFIEIWTVLASDLADGAAALVEANRLNGEDPLLKYAVADDHFVQLTGFFASPFTPELLHTVMTYFVGQIDVLTTTMVRRAGQERGRA